MRLPGPPRLTPMPWSSRSAPSAPLCPPLISRPKRPSSENEIKPGSVPTQPNAAPGAKTKKPKTDLSDESSSKKKKKKGIGKLNPF